MGDKKWGEGEGEKKRGGGIKTLLVFKLSTPYFESPFFLRDFA